MLNKIIDSQVRSSLTENKIIELQEHVQDSPVVPKYDPEDFEPGELTENQEEQRIHEMTEIFSHPSVSVVQYGGSYDVNSNNMQKLIELSKEAQMRSEDVFEMLEPGSPTDLQDDNGGFDLSLLSAPDAINKPYVWNTENSEWKDGKRAEAQKELNRLTHKNAQEVLYEKVKNDLEEKIPSAIQGLVNTEKIAQKYALTLDNPESYMQTGFDNRIIPESYLVVNDSAAVADKTGADEWLQDVNEQDLIEEASAMTADHLQDGYEGILYIEGSGQLGPESVVEEANKRLNRDLNENQNILLAYGGGISNQEDIETYLNAGADFVFVGNSIQERGPEALPNQHI